MLRFGVSACLMGEAVRYDGGHKRDDRVAALAGVAELVPFCPEVEIGLGVPREPIDLVEAGGATRLRGASGDHSGAMHELAGRRAAVLIEAGVSGYVLKSRSPSCGLRDVPVIRGGERVEAGARGVFTAAVAAAIEGLPMVDEHQLDARGRRQFLVRAGAWSRTAAVFGFGLERRWRRAELVAHHSREKLQVMAHSPEHYRRLGALVGRAAGAEPRELAADYRRQLMEALAEPPTPGRHVNAMQHIAGYLAGADRRRALDTIDAFAAGELTLDRARYRLLQLAERGGHQYLTSQSYLEPPPD